MFSEDVIEEKLNHRIFKSNEKNLTYKSTEAKIKKCDPEEKLDLHENKILSTTRCEQLVEIVGERRF